MCTGRVLSTADCRMIATLYCAVPFIVACVDVSRTLFWDRSVDFLTTFNEREQRFHYLTLFYLLLQKVSKIKTHFSKLP